MKHLKSKLIAEIAFFVGLFKRVIAGLTLCPHRSRRVVGGTKLKALATEQGASLVSHSTATAELRAAYQAF